MPTESENNKRIAKNTVYLYIRMFITMLVGLYTSRVVLNTLGVSDYGIFNVMGGIIGMLTYVNTLLSGATSRFLTIDIGKGDDTSLRQTFSMANTLSFIAVAIILILGETVGLWFMNEKLNIDPARMEAANWVYQCALASCALSVVQTPYTASIIAHEKMDIYAYMSLFDVAMKLLIVFMLNWIDLDKLELYALLIFAVNLLDFIIYRVICSRRFMECHFSFDFNKTKFKEMMNYSGWNMITAFTNILNNYGLNILLNIFFGTVVNAARGIALQISNIVQQFYSNFQTASRPQIMKYYAQENVKGMSNLICNSSKYSAFLLICLMIPIVFNIDDFLMIWLGQRPEYTSWFCRLMIIQSLFFAIDGPVGMGLHAVGRMKVPNLISGFFYLCVFPLAYVSFRLGASPIAGYSIYIMFTPFILISDLLILRHYSGFSIKRFLMEVIKPLLLVVFASSVLSYLFVTVVDGEGLLWFFARCGFSLLFTVLAICYLGMSKNVRKKVIGTLRAKLAR